MTFSIVLTLLILSETFGCSAELDSNYFGYPYGLWCPSGYGFMPVFLLLTFLIGLWIIFTLVIIIRYILVKKINKNA